MSAMTLDSGSYPHVRHTSRTNDPDRTHETPRPSHWLSATGLVLGGVVLLVASGIPLVLWATSGAHGPGRTLLLAITAVVLAAGAIALLLAWQIRIIDRQAELRLAEQRTELDQTAMAMACAAAKLRVSLAELPDQVRDRARVDAAAYMAVANGIERQTMNIGHAVQALAEQVEQRMAAVEQRVDARDEEYERGWVAGAAKAAEALGGGSGQVRPLRPLSR